MSKLIKLGLFVIVVLIGSSCSRGFDPQIHTEDYDRLKESMSRLLDLRASTLADEANSLDFDIRSNTNIWKFPDGSFAGKSYDQEFLKSIDQFAGLIGFSDSEETHRWICDVGKSIAGLRNEFNPSDHIEFLLDVTNQILDDIGAEDYLRTEEAMSCYFFFEQSSYIKYKDYGLKDRDGNTARSAENNMEALYGEGSGIHLMAKMIMVLSTLN